MSKTHTIRTPDDWHLHLRDKEALATTVPASANFFQRALVMPNLVPPLTTLEELRAYRQRILDAVPSNRSFYPFMTAYLNESVSSALFANQATTENWLLGAKLYPAGVTTNAQAGAKSIAALYPVLEAMQENDYVLQIHGEVNHSDIFDREALFIEEVLRPLQQDFPKLRMVLEHISTRQAVDFITESPETVAGTITPHHLHYNRNHLLAGGIRPHYYCLPILKSGDNQRAVQAAALSGNPKFFAGTDSAPHDLVHKENACGCAGIFSAPYALQLYCQFFDDHQALDALENFVSVYGAAFYRQPFNEGHTVLRQQETPIPERIPYADSYVVPMAAGECVRWSVIHDAQ